MSEHIKKLAKQAGMEWDTHIWCWLANPPHLEKFADLVRQDEREACAKLCDEIDTPDGWSTSSLSARIRARGNHEQD